MHSDTTTPTTVTERFDAADRPLSALLDAVPADRWDAPSPCEGWTARDVVAHLIGAQRDFLTGKGIDLGPVPPVDGDPATAWRAHRDEIRPLLDDAARMGTPFDGHFGPTTIGATLERFYVFDMVAHRWDLARAVDGDDSFTEEELDMLETGIAGFGAAIHMDGVCKPGVEAPAGADRRTRILALLGRRA